MGEVASQLFNETPTGFLQELRRGKYARANSAAPDVLHTIVQLGLQVEGCASHAGVVLLPPPTVEALLVDRRRPELAQSFRLAMLKLASQEAARLMAAGDHEVALPVALEALARGEALFKPAPALALFPLYLLAAQAHLGLRRGAQCEKCLGLANLLALREPEQTTNVMRAQLSRLWGQLYAFQARPPARPRNAARWRHRASFCRRRQQLEPRTSLGYYNLAQVLRSTGNVPGALACAGQVAAIWAAALAAAALGAGPDGGALPPGAPRELPVGQLQLLEVVEMLLVCARTRGALLRV
ncbi:hypothetical protein HT031_002321 [Scenedesmus sp. PABB004]|nr:hypothetical protein HT031_002321 [Scenedesmus sp. PABB004]